MMNYGKIREVANKEKHSHQHKSMKTVKFGRLGIMSSEKMPEILVDAEMLEKVMVRKWCMGTGGYPVASFESKVVPLHDYVMAQYFDEKPKGCYVDHINQDKLDNRIANLRFVTPQESSRNMPLKANNTSGYTGVSLTKYGTYRAYITANKKRIELGQYKTLDEAVNARREAETNLGFKTRPATIKEACNEAKDD